MLKQERGDRARRARGTYASAFGCHLRLKTSVHTYPVADLGEVPGFQSPQHPHPPTPPYFGLKR